MPVLIALLLCVLAGSASTQDSPPDVLLIVVDDLGWRDLGCYGGRAPTPHLDRLARQGMRFTQGYAASPVCSPTRASLMTGRQPVRMGITDWIPGEGRSERLQALPNARHLPHDEVTIPEALPHYSSAFLGKWHLGGDGSLPTDHGFASNVAGFHWGHPHRGYWSPYGMPELPDGPVGEYLPYRLADEVVRELETERDGPRLVAYFPYTVHTPIQAPPELVEQARDRLARPPQPDDFVPERHGSLTRVEQNDAAYLAMVEAMDESVGRVLDGLERLGKQESTLVILTSDNGGLSTTRHRRSCKTSCRPLRAGKGWIHEGGIRVPWIVRWPGVTRPGSVSDEPVTTMDLLPTLCDAAGVPAPSGVTLDGHSLAPILRGERRTVREDGRPRSLFFHYPHYHGSGTRPSTAVREGRWKLVHWHETNGFELYDLGRDPGETVDVAAANPQVAERLRSQLADWRQRTGARVPEPNPLHPDNLGGSHQDFELVREAALEDREGGGYRMRAGEAGLALRTLAGEPRRTLELSTTVTAAGGPWQNGFLVLGDASDPDRLITAGLYLGGGRIAVLEGEPGAGAETQAALQLDETTSHEIVMHCDLDTGTVRLVVGDTELVHELVNAPRALTHFGFRAMRTTTDFGTVDVGAREQK